MTRNIAVVAGAYGLILPQAALDAPRWGCLNLHGSLLPRWRSTASIQRAVMAGDAETGVMVMKMEAGSRHRPRRLDGENPDRRRDDRRASCTTDSPSSARALMAQALDAAGARRTALSRRRPTAGARYAQKIEKAEGADRLAPIGARPS